MPCSILQRGDTSQMKRRQLSRTRRALGTLRAHSDIKEKSFQKDMRFFKGREVAYAHTLCQAVLLSARQLIKTILSLNMKIKSRKRESSRGVSVHNNSSMLTVLPITLQLCQTGGSRGHGCVIQTVRFVCSMRSHCTCPF